MGTEPSRGPGALPEGLDRTRLTAVVRDALADELASGARAGLAVSGGPDSVALALLVSAARPDLDLVVLHVRHGLRDDAGDAAAARATAEHLGLPCRIESVRVAPDGAGPEAAARGARHAAFRELATAHRLAAVLLGHTAEDRAETVLLNLVRGTGLQGLAALRHSRVVGGLRLLRPLLDLRRSDVRAVSAAAGVPVFHDPTNDDAEQRRSRARRLLPELARLAGGPGDPVGALTRLAALAGDDDALLSDQAAAVADGIVHTVGDTRLVAACQLDSLPVALARRVARRLLTEVRGARDLSARDVEAVLDPGGDARREMAGAIAERSRGWVVLCPSGAVAAPERALPVEGDVALPEIGAVLRVVAGAAIREDGQAAALPAEPGTVGDAPGWLPDGQAVALPAAPEGWRARGARPGDAIAAGGRRRPLAELQRAAGVPRLLRPLLPVVTDRSGTVLWMPGVAVADVLPEGGPYGLQLLGSGGARALGYPPGDDSDER